MSCKQYEFETHKSFQLKKNSFLRIKVIKVIDLQHEYEIVVDFVYKKMGFGTKSD